MTDFAISRPVSAQRRPPPGWHRHLHGSELTWAIAFIVPYAAVFVVFLIYPVVYGLWMGSDPALYADLVDDPRYLRTVANTLIYVGLAVNVKMFLALLLSGFFMRRRRWIKGLLVIYILPWTLPAVPAFLSIHWMLIGPEGLHQRDPRPGVRDRRPVMADRPLARSRQQHRHLHLEMDAAVDADLPGGPHGDPAGIV